MEEQVRQALAGGDPGWVGWGLCALADATRKGSDGKGFSRYTAKQVVYRDSRRAWTVAGVARVVQARRDAGLPWTEMVQNPAVRVAVGRVIARHTRQLVQLWAEAQAASQRG